MLTAEPWMPEAMAVRASRASFPQPRRQPVSLNPALAKLAASRRVLLLQGPVGPLFDRIARWLVERGSAVSRVAFHGGDAFDSRIVRPMAYSGKPSGWPRAFDALVSALEPDCVVLFGQARYYHRVALDRARKSGIDCIVLEEGYFRPGFVTMEIGGVNAASSTLEHHQFAASADCGALAPDFCQHHFAWMAWHATRHYVAMDRGARTFPAYVHHRSTDIPGYCKFWLRSWGRKLHRLAADSRVQASLIASGQPYFFVPLQMDGDSQVAEHSPFGTCTEFTMEVLRSFARHAPQDAWLVIKQHPLARGGGDPGPRILAAASALGIAPRVRWLLEGSAPELAEHSLGTVVINSTVGLQAIERATPVIALGDAIYKREGLVFPGGLDRFWEHRKRPDPVRSRAFLTSLKGLTQVPASAYAPLHTPLAWSPLLDA